MKLNIQMFATSETYYGSFNGSYGSAAQLYIVRTISQNKDTLETAETLKLYIKKVSNQTNAYNSAASYSIKKNGTNVKSGTCSFNFNGASIGTTTLLATYTTTLKHDSDGKYDDYDLTVSLVTGTTSLANGSLSKNVTTPDIPVSFAVAIPNFDLGQNPVITVGVDNSEYTYDLRYSISTEDSELTGDIVKGIVSTSYIWEMSEDLIRNIKLNNPTTSKIKVTVYCDTYDGDTLKGTRDASCVTNIVGGTFITGIEAIETNSTIKQYTGGTSYISGLSKIKLRVSYSLDEGATLSKIEVYVNNSLLGSYNTNEIMIENITTNVDGYVTLSVKVIDSRENFETMILEQWLPFVEYLPCEYINTECILSRSSDIDHISAMLKANVYNGLIGSTANSVKLTYKYKIKDSSDPYVFGTTVLLLNTSVLLDETFDHTKNYEIIFMIEDLIYEGNPMTKIIASTEYIMCEYKDGVDFKNAWIKGKQIPTLEDDSRNIITVTTSANVNVAVGSKVPFNRTEYKKGSKLTSNDENGVVIGAGVTEVLVSFQINGSYNGRQWYIGVLNEGNTSISAIGKSGADGYTTLVASPRILKVEEGDVITVKSQSAGAVNLNGGMGTNYACYMTVEDVTPQLAVGGSDSSGGSGTTNYDELYNKPLINSVLLTGNKSFDELGAASLTNLEIEDVINSVVI